MGLKKPPSISFHDIFPTIQYFRVTFYDRDNNMTRRYLESQYVTGPYLAWTDTKRCPYLYHNVGGDLVSPPLGMRSSVPLGGKSSRIGGV